MNRIIGLRQIERSASSDGHKLTKARFCDVYLPAGSSIFSFTTSGAFLLPFSPAESPTQSPERSLVSAHPHARRSMQLALFAASITWAVAAAGLANRAARGIGVRFQLSEVFLLLHAVFLVFLLVCGIAVLQGIVARNTPLRTTLGLPRHPTARAEWATGAAIGWAVVLLAVLPIALAGALHVRLWIEGRSIGLALLNLATLALLALASEIAFRGYAFGRLIDAIGPGWATFAMSLLFALIGSFDSDATYLSVLIAAALGVVLSLAWLRTHALWFSWGIHFALVASLGILFGLPVGLPSASVDNISSIVQSRAIGPLWLTGGDLGVEGAPLTLLLLIAVIPIVVLVSSDWAWAYARKPLIPAGRPMDVQPPAEHAAMESQAAAAPPALVQILPSTPQTRSADLDR